MEEKLTNQQDSSRKRVRKAPETNTFLEQGRVPPQAIDLEEAVLGAIMLEKDALTNVIDILKPETFYKDSHKEIYAAIVDLFNNSEPVDLLTVTNRLRKKGKLDLVGGAYYITELTSKVNSAAHIEYHARIIIEKAIKLLHPGMNLLLVILRLVTRAIAALLFLGTQGVSLIFQIVEKPHPSRPLISSSFVIYRTYFSTLE
jgi:hypothetical protein